MLWGMIATRYLSRDISPRINRERCLRDKGLKNCNHCRLACPRNAIVIDGEVAVDSLKCSGCAICAAACPTGCIELTGTNWINHFKNSLSLKAPSFGCRSSIEPDTNILVPCIGAIPSELIAAVSLITGKTISFDLKPCYRCENHTALRQFRRSLRKASKLTGKTLEYKCYLPQKTEPEEPHIGITGEVSLLKRNFGDYFGSFLNTIFKEESSKPSKDDLPDTQLFLKAVLKLNPESVLHLNSWEATSKCYGCGACRQSCPGKAWSMVNKEKNSALIHQPLRCSGCSLCAEICPGKAKKKKTIQLKGGEAERLIAKTFKTARCKTCRQIIMGENKTGKCPNCQKRAALLSQDNRISPLP